MNYTQATEYLYSALPVFHRQGKAAYKADISTTITLMNAIGNPQNSFRSIHIAGTNGKGSSSHMIASILRESGLKVGLHTSPHLRDMRERIMVDGKMCSKNYIISFLKKYKKEIEVIQPSFFELMVAMAFKYFEQKKIDVAVVEVGMGGRLDSTNIISPLCSLITNISWDHMQFLGDTLPKIAAEKAGIIKHNTPIVISQTQDEVKEVFLKKASEMNAPIMFADDKYTVTNDRSSGNGLQFDIEKDGKVFLKNLKPYLRGDYQKKNILGVLAVIEKLNQSKMFSITKQQIRDGIEHLDRDFILRGRWQTLCENPLTICDTGHNEDGLHYVTEQLKKMRCPVLHFVFGMVSDKDLDAELKLLPKDAKYYLCKADIPRGMNVDILAAKFREKNMDFTVHTSVKAALKAAQKDARKTSGLVFVGGSTYTVAEIV